MTMHRFTKKTTALLTGFALVGASQLILVQSASAESRGGVHYRGGRHGGPGGPGGHNNTRRAYHAGQRQGFHRGFHAGMHRGFHAAHFHGFHVGWRPHPLIWHPIGFLLTTMAVTAIVVNANNKKYQYDQGVYYVQVDGGYKAVTAPIGANIPELPDDTQDVTVGSTTYYYYQGTFYTQDDKGFTVAAAPAGAMVSYVPQGYTTTTVNGTIYYEYGGVDYQPKMVDGGTAYVVVRV